MAYDNRDNIDFGKEDIRKLFNKLFIPTLLGMLFNLAFILRLDGSPKYAMYANIIWSMALSSSIRAHYSHRRRCTAY